MSEINAGGLEAGTEDKDARWERIRAFGGPSVFLAEVTSRNAGIISEEEQAALQAAQILVAGCGSVGGAVVEPLVRLGVGTLVLADLDSYDWHNLNRQACRIVDIGAPKPTVLAERAVAINPLVRVLTHNEGITRENVRGLIEDATLIFDGLDASGESLWIKYLIHRHAAALRKPVVLGADVGGKPTLFVYDYRRDGRPFYGRAKEVYFAEGREIDATRAMTGILSIPTDFFPVICQRVRTSAPWPQVAYTATGIGAISTRTIVDLLCGRRVGRVVAADLHMLPRSRSVRVRQRVTWPLAALRALAVTRSAATGEARLAASVDTEYADPDPVSKLSPKLFAVSQAIRLAPSAFNAQPWRIRIGGADTLAIEFDRSQPPGGKAAGLLRDIDLGCAIEAANRVAHVHFKAAEAPAGDPGSSGGELLVERERTEGLVAAVGLLHNRRTDRRRYRREPLGGTVLARLQTRVEQQGVKGFMLASQPAEVARWAQTLAREHGLVAGWRTDSDEGWLRLGRNHDAAGTGITLEQFGIAPRALGMLGRTLPSRIGKTAMVRSALARILVARQTAMLADSGALIMLPIASASVSERVALGRALMDLLLTAMQHGLSSHVITVESTLVGPPRVDESDTSRCKSPGLLVRLGVPRSPGFMPTRRLLLSEILLDGYVPSPDR